MARKRKEIIVKKRKTGQITTPKALPSNVAVSSIHPVLTEQMAKRKEYEATRPRFRNIQSELNRKMMIDEERKRRRNVSRYRASQSVSPAPKKKK